MIPEGLEVRERHKEEGATTEEDRGNNRRGGVGLKSEGLLIVR